MRNAQLLNFVMTNSVYSVLKAFVVVKKDPTLKTINAV